MMLEELLRPLLSVLLSGVFAWGAHRITKEWRDGARFIVMAGILEWTWLTCSSALGPRLLNASTHVANSVLGTATTLLALSLFIREDPSIYTSKRVTTLGGIALAGFVTLRLFGVSVLSPLDLTPGLGVALAVVRFLGVRTQPAPDATTAPPFGKSIAILSVTTLFLATASAVYRSDLNTQDYRFVSLSQAKQRLFVAPWDSHAWLAAAWARRSKKTSSQERAQDLFDVACQIHCKPWDELEFKAELSALAGKCDEAQRHYDDFVLARAKQQLADIDLLTTRLELQAPRVPPSLSEFCPRPSLLDQ